MNKISHIGFDPVQATPMNRADYNVLRGWTLPADENGADEGFLLQHEDGGPVNWVTAERFDAGYRPLLGLDFGGALRAVMEGRRIARAGWNGKGMSVFLGGGSVDVTDTRDSIDGVNRIMFALGDVGTVTRMPSLCLTTASGAVVVGWAPSQTDLLAEDWTALL
jgi:hypothetical protein